jgi:hypothetical protein
MYYTALNASLSPPANCIGVATSPVPAGPFTDAGILDTDPPSADPSGRPLGCGDAAGYSNISRCAPRKIAVVPVGGTQLFLLPALSSPIAVEARRARPSEHRS